MMSYFRHNLYDDSLQQDLIFYQSRGIGVINASPLGQYRNLCQSLVQLVFCFFCFYFFCFFCFFCFFFKVSDCSQTMATCRHGTQLRQRWLRPVRKRGTSALLMVSAFLSWRSGNYSCYQPSSWHRGSKCRITSYSTYNTDNDNNNDDNSSNAGDDDIIYNSTKSENVCKVLW